jgi:F420-0:gamma-glutamyl ligase
MHVIPVTTPVLRPPQADLQAALQLSLPSLLEGDVLVISSKVVSLDEGRCLPVVGSDKEALVATEAELFIPRPYWNRPLTVARHAFVGSAGIDESNGDGHYVLLPVDVFASAQRLWQWVRAVYGLARCGVIISDSASAPFRLGASGIALAWWGIEPLRSHQGRHDLFGRAIVAERSNVVDPLAAAAVLVGGEVDESTPVVIAREVPGLTYTDRDTRDQLLVPFTEDIFRVLYERWLPS